MPAFAVEQVARVLTKGSEKYADRNWEKGMDWTSKVLASLKRHLIAFERGEDFDPETGLLHMAHVACNAMFLTEYYKIYPQGDDRPHNYLTVPKIGLDIDEVLCDWVGAWTAYYNMQVPDSWFFDRGIVEKFDAMKKEGVLEDFYLGLQPLIDPKDIPFEPHCYITSRPCSLETTMMWLDMHGFPARPVYTVDVDHPKIEVAKESGIEIFVDDRYENFVDLNRNGICTFLYDAPHNRRYDVGFKRITNLSQLLYENSENCIEETQTKKVEDGTAKACRKTGCHCKGDCKGPRLLQQSIH